MSEEPTDKSVEDLLLEEELQQFKRAYRLTLNAMTIHVNDAAKYQNEIANATTNHKVKFYEKKFSKTKAKFQDELARLVQLEHILKTNGVDVKALAEEESDVKPAEEQLKEFGDGE